MVQFTSRRSLGEERQPSIDFAALAAAEDRHFWFAARNRVIQAVFRKLVPTLAPGYRVLEVGCGTGNVLRALVEVCRHGQLVGSELFEEALRRARRRVRCPLVQADVYRLPFAVSFDLIGMFDVLEHLPDDGEALGEVYRQLHPGGRLVITVPAHPALWSHADDYAGHYRRYSPAGLRGALTRAGFRIDYLSHFMAPLVPLVWLRRRLARLLNRVGPGAGKSPRELALRDLTVVPVLNRCLAWLLAPEAPLLAGGRRLPIGTSLLAVATRAAPAPAASRSPAC
jgi:SAM-dependent methyltransferase